MSKAKTNWILVILALLIFAVGTACGGDSSTIVSNPPNPRLDSQGILCTAESPTFITTSQETQTVTIEPPTDSTGIEELAMILTEFEPKIREVRQLDVENDRIAYELLNSSQIATYIEESFEDDLAEMADEISAEETVYKLLGIIRCNDNLIDILTTIYSGSVLGVYDGEIVRVLVDDSMPVTFGAVSTYVHEYVHYLQDQHFGIIGESMRNYDEELAFTALVEGDATYTSGVFVGRNAERFNDFGDLLETVDLEELQMRRRIAQSYSYILSLLDFPYSAGTEFLSGFISENRLGQINSIFEDPPRSTEQILIPTKYFVQDMRDDPIEIDVAFFKQHRSWDISPTPYDETLGIYALNSWVTNTLMIGDGDINITPQQAQFLSGSAAGWGGDRLRLLERDDGSAGLQWLIAWDNPETDAREFELALNGIATLNLSLIRDGGPCNLPGHTVSTLVYDDNVLVHTVFEHPTLGVMNSIAVSNSCATALELLTTTTN